MRHLFKVAFAALLLVVSSTAVVGATPPADTSNAFAVEGRPIEAVICHVDDDGSAKYVMVRSKSALENHLQEHSKDYKFGSKIGACETGGAEPPKSATSGSDAKTPDLGGLNISEANDTAASESNDSASTTAEPNEQKSTTAGPNGSESAEAE